MLRGVRGFAVTLTALAMLATTAGCGGAGGAGGNAAAAEPPAVFTDSSQSASATPSVASPTSAPPSVRPGAARSTAPTRMPVPTQKPQIPLPPPPNQPQVPPPSTSTSGATCPSYAGPKAPVADVKAALTTAAGTPYWTKTSKPEGYTGNGSEITVPLTLIKAIAWQESGWQSTIIACDGGIGTMQVMPGTADWMNGRFGTSYNVNTLSGNTALGAEYLQWLIMYFGLYYFGSFDLSATADVGVGGATMRLRDVVIAGYNVGPGALENSDDTLEIPNQRYVDSVVALMSNCVCLSY